MSLGFLIGVFVVALAFVLVSIIKFNLHPFLSLLLGGLIMGILAGLPLTDVSTGLAAGFGSTMQSIGILIILEWRLVIFCTFPDVPARLLH